MEEIILASSSPRRKEILEKYDLFPTIISSDIMKKPKLVKNQNKLL